ncbi:MAG: uroporphyrinogen decarboxylase family protein [Bacteroidales bacterium]|nr:uroporphyrinogen decarboxylase family protein [Bacteroidales bacterium]
MNGAFLQDEIKRLVSLIEEKIDSPKNRLRQVLWDKNGFPHPDAEKIPITVSPEIQMWSKLHNISLIDFYQIPELYVYGQLKAKVFAFDNFNDDRPIDRVIWMWLGTPFEGSLLGIPFDFFINFEPDDGGVIIYSSCIEAVEKIKQPNFFTSGMMPLAHRMYEGCKTLLPGDYNIIFPDYIQTPLATATHLVGTELFLMEAIDNSEAARQLLARLLEIRVQFRKDRANFLGIGLERGIYDNDHVSTPMISPGLYRDLIWPVENELAVREGGIAYWHSCGNTTAMLDRIKKLPGLGLLHISAWTDRCKAAEILDRNLPLQVCVHSLKEVLCATDSQIKASLADIIKNLGHHRIKIDADCFQTFMEMSEQVRRIRHWTDLAQKMTGEENE